MPAAAVRDTLDQLRLSSDPLMVLERLRGGSPTNQPSEQRTAQAILPPTHTGLEFELMVRYPMSYPAIDPSRDDGLARSLLLDPARVSVLADVKNFWDLREIYSTIKAARRPNSPFLYSASSGTIMQPQSSRGPSVPVTLARLLPKQMVGPQPGPHYFNPRLSHVNISFLSTVPVSNEFAAHVISNYFETDHVDSLINIAFSLHQLSHLKEVVIVTKAESMPGCGRAF